MKLGKIICCFFVAAGLGLAEEKPSLRGVIMPVLVHAPKAWLGMDLAKPDPTLTVHLPSLPPGIGFVIRSISEEGPAQAAGLEQMDLFWKLDDQMLVNEAQLAALLRLRQPGEEVTLAVIRSGTAMEVKLKLGEAPVVKGHIADQALEVAMFPGDAGPMRVVNIAAKEATYATSKGRILVRREGDLYVVEIHGPENEVIYQGHLSKDGELSKVPEGWRRKVCVLKRGLDQSLENRMVPARQPRPRVVPPPPAK